MVVVAVVLFHGGEVVVFILLHYSGGRCIHYGVLISYIIVEWTHVNRLNLG